MRAWQATGIGEPRDVLQQVAIDAPAMRERAVRISIECAGLNLFDDLMIRGKYQKQPPVPFVPGSEVVGTVRESAVPDLSVGSRVAALTADGAGALAEECVVSANRVLRLPETVPSADAVALLVNFHTAYLALHGRAALQKGESLLVHGAAGGVGSAAVQLGCAMGARVFATVRGGDQAEQVRLLGAEAVVDTGEGDHLAFADVVKEKTDGTGVDVVCDLLGGDYFDRSLRIAAWGGRIITIGYAAGRIPELAANKLLLRNLAVLGANFGGSIAREPNLLQQTHAALLDLHAAGAIRPQTTTFELDDLPEALRRVRTGDLVGKAVVSVSPAASVTASTRQINQNGTIA